MRMLWHKHTERKKYRTTHEQVKMPTNATINKSITINATPAQVWKALTNPDDVRCWIAEHIQEIEYHWVEGGSILLRGELHGVPYENKGKVLGYEPEKYLSYNYWTTISLLKDKSENYTILEFELIEQENTTLLTLHQHNFATKTMYKHWEFYWMVTLDIFRKYVEKQSRTASST